MTEWRGFIDRLAGGLGSDGLGDPFREIGPEYGGTRRHPKDDRRRYERG